MILYARRTWSAVVAATILLAGPAFAQEGEADGHGIPHEPNREFEVFGAVVFANMSGDAAQWGDDAAAGLSAAPGENWSSGKSTRTGAGFGISIWSRVTPTFKVGATFQSMQRGVAYTFNEAATGAVVQSNFKIHYYEISWLADFCLALNWPVTPRFFFGPLFGYDQGNEVPAPFSGEDSPYVESWYIGGIVGLSGTYSISPKTHVLIRFRYTTSFTDQMRADYVMKSSDFDIAAGWGIAYRK